ncbi:hypothetical protein B5F53_16020 [Blautia sp. An249]|uniref:hypothetical protein n=1 Tax=Blautia sp. An249 TaxID=1965603 RepID=UPI000B3A4E81|nr:hypothetical protein [Blautia sp. An249]OUO76755.1 hypothetical protein B5F53_16020 [Blautia sp. An249]
MAEINFINRFHIMDRIYPGKCPNFYLSGHSIGLLEDTAMEIAKIIKDKKLLQFKGLVPCFSILMPYYDSMSNAEQFMNRLMASYSIARDCYDVYKGIIIIECSEDWNEYGYNSYMELLTSFIKEHEEICFLMLFPEKNKSKYQDALYGEFTKNRLWIRYRCNTLNVEECIDFFCKEAEFIGYSVTNDTKCKLNKMLHERSEFLVENKKAVMQLLKQIQLNKILQPDSNNLIMEDDLEIISGLSDRSNSFGIGFNAKIR